MMTQIQQLRHISDGRLATSTHEYCAMNSYYGATRNDGYQVGSFLGYTWFERCYERCTKVHSSSPYTLYQR